VRAADREGKIGQLWASARKRGARCALITVVDSQRASNRTSSVRKALHAKLPSDAAEESAGGGQCRAAGSAPLGAGSRRGQVAARTCRFTGAKTERLRQATSGWRGASCLDERRDVLTPRAAAASRAGPRRPVYVVPMTGGRAPRRCPRARRHRQRSRIVEGLTAGMKVVRCPRGCLRSGRSGADAR